MSEKCNGWTNFETWSAALYLNDYAYELIHDEGMSAEDAAETMKAEVEERIGNAIDKAEECGAIANEFSKFMWYAFQEINFEEIAKNSME